MPVYKVSSCEEPSTDSVTRPPRSRLPVRSGSKFPVSSADGDGTKPSELGTPQRVSRLPVPFPSGSFSKHQPSHFPAPAAGHSGDGFKPKSRLPLPSGGAKSPRVPDPRRSRAWFLGTVSSKSSPTPVPPIVLKGNRGSGRSLVAPRPPEHPSNAAGTPSTPSTAGSRPRYELRIWPDLVTHAPNQLYGLHARGAERTTITNLDPEGQGNHVKAAHFTLGKLPELVDLEEDSRQRVVETIRQAIASQTPKGYNRLGSDGFYLDPLFSSLDTKKVGSYWSLAEWPEKFRSLVEEELNSNQDLDADITVGLMTRTEASDQHRKESRSDGLAAGKSRSIVLRAVRLQKDLQWTESRAQSRLQLGHRSWGFEDPDEIDAEEGRALEKVLQKLAMRPYPTRSLIQRINSVPLTIPDVAATLRADEDNATTPSDGPPRPPGTLTLAVKDCQGRVELDFKVNTPCSCPSIEHSDQCSGLQSDTASAGRLNQWADYLGISDSRKGHFAKEILTRWSKQTGNPAEEVGGDPNSIWRDFVPRIHENAQP